MTPRSKNNFKRRIGGERTIKVLLILVSAVLFALCPGVFASGETIGWQTISAGGAGGSSTVFKLQGTVGQTAVGNGGSVNYGVSHGYWQVFESADGCCVGVRGDVNCSGGEPDISDITRLIDFLYLSYAPLCCAGEADVNAGGGEPDISDITRLIDFLYLSHAPLADCP